MVKNLETDEIKFILNNNYIGHLGYVHHGKPYVIPITYFYDEELKAIICYSGEGHKISAMRKNNAVCIQINEIDTVNRWKSVLVHGTFEIYFGSDAKVYLHRFSLGVKDVITEKEHQRPAFISEFSSKIYKEDIPIVFLIKIEEMTGKKRNF